MRRLFLSALFCLSIGLPALAQPVLSGAPAAPVGPAVVCPTCYMPLPASTSSGATAQLLPASAPPYDALTIQNNGSQDACFFVGASNVAVNWTEGVCSNWVVRAGRGYTISLSGLAGSYIAAATQSSTTTLDLYQANAAILLTAAAGGSSGGGGGTSSAFGAAFPTNGTAAGFYDTSGNMDYGTVDNSHNQNVNCVVGCSGASNPSVGANGSSAPASSTALGFQNGSGNLLQVAPGNPLPATDAAAESSLSSINSSNTTIASNTGAISSSSGSTATSVESIANIIANAGVTPTKAGAIQGISGGVPVPMTAATLPLPTGAAQESGGNLAGIASSNTTIASNTGSIATSSSSTATNTGNTASSTSSTATNTSGIKTDTDAIANAVANPGSTSTKAASVQGCNSCTPVTTIATSTSWAFSAAPTMATSSHATNSCLGGQFTINGYAGLSDIEVTDKGTNFNGASIGVYISTSALATPCTDGAAFSLAAGDMTNIPAGLKGLVFIPNTSGGWTSISNQVRSNLGVWLTGTYPTTLYVNVVLGSGAVTPTSGELLIQGSGPV
jgi:hypothetical protein